jgi:hypothetical protein
MIPYIKDPKDSTKKRQTLLDLTNTFDNIAGYKISIPKSIIFVYANSEQAEKINQQNNHFNNNLKNM